jgi:protein gp37
MKNSSIEWTTDTFNPWWGCTKVSPGCTHCYAETLSNRYGKDVWGAGKQRLRTSAKYWEGPLAWDRKAARTGQIRRVFCASMADVFDPEVPAEWRADLFELIRQTQNLSWLLLTKRPSEIPSLGLPPETVWLGTSVEDQRRAQERIPQLLKIPATVHFLSVEPLLEPVDLGSLQGINWIICGGESGPRCRPMNIEWARSVRDQCRDAGIAFFCKQLGGHPDKRKRMDQFPEDLRIREFPESSPIQQLSLL